jgi:hypothetical protein
MELLATSQVSFRIYVCVCCLPFSAGVSRSSCMRDQSLWSGSVSPHQRFVSSSCFGFCLTILLWSGLVLRQILPPVHTAVLLDELAFLPLSLLIRLAYHRFHRQLCGTAPARVSS